MSATITVEDILGARPSLRERARQALAIREAAEQQAFLDMRNELIAEAEDFMTSKLRVLPPDLPSDYIDDMTVAVGQAIRWKLEGFEFRLYFKEVTKKAGHDDSRSYTDHEAVFHVKKNHSWSMVASLADLGKILD